MIRTVRSIFAHKIGVSVVSYAQRTAECAIARNTGPSAAYVNGLGLPDLI